MLQAIPRSPKETFKKTVQIGRFHKEILDSCLVFSKQVNFSTSPVLKSKSAISESLMNGFSDKSPTKRTSPGVNAKVHGTTVEHRESR